MEKVQLYRIDMSALFPHRDLDRMASMYGAVANAMVQESHETLPEKITEDMIKNHGLYIRLTWIFRAFESRSGTESSPDRNRLL